MRLAAFQPTLCIQLPWRDWRLCWYSSTKSKSSDVITWCSRRCHRGRSGFKTTLASWLVNIDRVFHVCSRYDAASETAVFRSRVDIRRYCQSWVRYTPFLRATINKLKHYCRPRPQSSKQERYWPRLRYMAYFSWTGRTPLAPWWPAFIRFWITNLPLRI